MPNLDSRTDRDLKKAKEIIDLMFNGGVDKIVFEAGFYGCESGCDYYRVYACQEEVRHFVYGSFDDDKAWKLAVLLAANRRVSCYKESY
jgi:hypothetical protein